MALVSQGRGHPLCALGIERHLEVSPKARKQKLADDVLAIINI
jgi:hypothetical protein